MRSAAAKTLPQSEVTSICIEDLRLNGGTQPRAEINQAVVGEYAEAMRRGEKLPPPVVFFDGTDYWLADGFHRVYAARETEASFMLCEVRQGTWREAVFYSTGANAAHGLPRTYADKRRAVQRLLDDPEWAKMSALAIAKHCKVGDDLVAEVRSATFGSESKERTYERNGKLQTMRIENIGRSSGGGFRERDDPPERQVLSEHEARRLAVVDRYRPIVHAIQEAVEVYDRLPSVSDATREFPKALRSFVDVKKLRALSAWLTEFADALERRAH